MFQSLCFKLNTYTLHVYNRLLENVKTNYFYRNLISQLRKEKYALHYCKHLSDEYYYLRTRGACSMKP